MSPAMKPDIHPEYHEITIVMTDGTTFKTSLGLNTIETAKAAGKKIIIQSVN